MKDFIAFFGEFIVVIAVAGMLLAMAPDGSQKKYIHFAISLSVLSALIGPMLSVVSELPEILENAEFSVEVEQTDLEGNLEDAVIAASKRNMETSIASMLSQKFEIPEEKLHVSVVLNTDDTANIEIISVNVSAQDTTYIEREEMRKYLTEILMDHCKVDISDGER
jgi:hypothetical protein